MDELEKFFNEFIHELTVLCACILDISREYGDVETNKRYTQLLHKANIDEVDKAMWDEAVTIAESVIENKQARKE